MQIRRGTDITGCRFGRLVVVGPSHTDTRNSYWVCRCDCGQESIVCRTSLVSGATNSCGCLRLEMITKHGCSPRSGVSPEYSSWLEMNARCNNPNNQHYKNYGARGITVCDEWKDFSVFLGDMGEKPSPKHTIERTKNDQGYTPENCKWATRAEQNRNHRRNVNITARGKTQCLSDWSAELGINRATLNHRLFGMKMSFEEAVLYKRG